MAEAEAEAEGGVEQEAEFQHEPAELAPIVKLSDKIHVVGFDPHARLITHALAAVPELPPVQMLIHNTMPLTKWGEEGRAINVFDYDLTPRSTQNIRCPEYIGNWRVRLGKKPILDNIVVSTLSGAVLPTMYHLRPYIDRRTTLCLLQPGLGMMELLNEHVFVHPELRPNYVLCHSEHRLERHSSYKYSLRHLPGNLLLCAVPRDGDSELDKRTAEALGSQHSRHLVDLLISADDLQASGRFWELFLRRKLPSMIYQSLADTLSVMLGCRYDELRGDHYAMSMWSKLLNETLDIVSALPEARTHPELFSYFYEPSFRRRLKKKLERSAGQYSRWISMVRRGQMPPVDYCNGYFVRRARELGLAHAQNSFALYTVKARQAGRHRELRTDVSFGLQPYMDDRDRVGGGQDAHDPLIDDVDLDCDF